MYIYTRAGGPPRIIVTCRISESTNRLDGSLAARINNDDAMLILPRPSNAALIIVPCRSSHLADPRSQTSVSSSNTIITSAVSERNRRGEPPRARSTWLRREEKERKKQASTSTSHHSSNKPPLLFPFPRYDGTTQFARLGRVDLARTKAQNSRSFTLNSITIASAFTFRMYHAREQLPIYQ